jgi:hypothetical protein
MDTEDLSQDNIEKLLSLLFQTYPRYYDRPSRRAVQKCLHTIASNPTKPDALTIYVKLLEEESAKRGIASSSAFVLVEWSSDLVQELSKNFQAWKKHGIKVAVSYAAILETCISGEKRESVKHSAVIVTRRAFRVLLQKLDEPDKVLTSLVSELTSRGSTPKARNSLILGIIAGVSARIPAAQTVLRGLRKEYYAFYVREIIGSRTILPAEIARGLHDFFQSFATAEDLEKEVAPSIEKALLRAPEIVLNGLIAPIAESIPAQMDLSQMLYKNLLKPILSNIKSSNPAIRNGALATFEKFAARSLDESINEKLAEELLNPLKQKATSAEQKVIYSQMLAALNGFPILSRKIPAALVSIALKESNEAAISAEVVAATKHLQHGFALSCEPESSVLETYVKAIGDKRVGVRRPWALQLGQLIWQLTKEQMSQEYMHTFLNNVVEAMTISWKEILANPLQAAQSGLVVLGYIFIALILSKLASNGAKKSNQWKAQYETVKKNLTAQTSPPFLLNHRVYTKVTNEDDLIWAIRALGSMSTLVASGGVQEEISDGWAQAFIYCVTAAGLPRSIHEESMNNLRTVYAQNPSDLGHVVIEGLWNWYRHLELSEKDTAAFAAKSAYSELKLVVKSIYPTAEEAEKMAVKVDPRVLEHQLIESFILARPRLIPHVSWIDLCLRTGVDPGKLVDENCKSCMDKIITATQVIT